MDMNKQLQELLERKIKIYEHIISEIKTNDFELIAKFESAFQKIENIDRTINSDDKLHVEKLLKIRL